jgi:hypothetical protein
MCDENDCFTYILSTLKLRIFEKTGAFKCLRMRFVLSRSYCMDHKIYNLFFLQGRGALQDIDQMSLFKPLCKYCASVTKIRDIVPTLKKALHEAQSGTPGRAKQRPSQGPQVGVNRGPVRDPR